MAMANTPPITRPRAGGLAIVCHRRASNVRDSQCPRASKDDAARQR